MKIVVAVNAMIANSELITSVLPGTSSSELFFQYNNIHKWSVVRNNDTKNVSLFYYPGSGTVQQLAAVDPQDWEQVPYVRYGAEEFNSVEAKESFNELYRIVSEKRFGMDEVLDQIISGF